MQKKLKKAIFTLNFNNYAPEITELTYPYIQRYANKIGADFMIITERKFPDYPWMYEKLQIYELGQKMKNDWNIYIDSDALIHPDLFDITEVLPLDTVLNYASDYANIRFRYDNYFRRDGRNIGAANFLTVASHLCIDLWEPLSDLTIEEAIKNIHPTHREEMLGRKDGYSIIDDYVISRNIAKYHLKYKTFKTLLDEIGRTGDEYFFHNHLITESEKLEEIKRVAKNWRL